MLNHGCFVKLVGQIYINFHSKHVMQCVDKDILNLFLSNSNFTFFIMSIQVTLI
jgi:hypothetical protein